MILSKITEFILAIPSIIEGVVYLFNSFVGALFIYVYERTIIPIFIILLILFLNIYKRNYKLFIASIIFIASTIGTHYFWGKVTFMGDMFPVAKVDTYYILGSISQIIMSLSNILMFFFFIFAKKKKMKKIK